MQPNQHRIIFYKKKNRCTSTNTDKYIYGCENPSASSHVRDSHKITHKIERFRKSIYKYTCTARAHHTRKDYDYDDVLSSISFKKFYTSLILFIYMYVCCVYKSVKFEIFFRVFCVTTTTTHLCVFNRTEAKHTQ